MRRQAKSAKEQYFQKYPVSVRHHPEGGQRHGGKREREREVKKGLRSFNFTNAKSKAGVLRSGGVTV